MAIEISRISLDVENFRHRKATNEREAMKLILADEKTHKVSELAQDIVQMKGLDPSSLLIVTEDPGIPGCYIALEGNRRITALKTLASPELAAGTPGYPTFKKLSGPFLALGLTEVECVVLGRKAAFDWIKRKHYNAMGGRGVVGWNAIATARSDASEGRFARWMTGLNYLESHGENIDALLDNISNKTTTVERVLVSPSIAAVLGLIFDRTGNLLPENGDHVAARKLLVAMFEEMGKKDFVEPKVTSADLQKEFIDRFAHLSVKKVVPAQNKSSPNNTNSNNAGTAGGNASRGNSGTSGGGGGTPAQPANQGSTSTRSKPVKQRKHLADKGLRISNYALNKLYDELKKLNVETNPHIGAAIMRVFLEKATMVFLVDMAVPCHNPNGWSSFDVKLRDKVKAALHVVDPQKKNHNLLYARDVSNGVQDKLHTLDHLNRAIHDHLALPSPSEIVQVWDRYHPYFQELFKELEKNGK